MEEIFKDIEELPLTLSYLKAWKIAHTMIRHFISLSADKN